MKTQLPSPDMSTAHIFGLSEELVKWQMMKTALELNVFDYLSNPSTSEEISNKLKTDQNNTETLLNGLTALGCLNKISGKFHNTPSTEACWKSTGETSLAKSFLFYSHWVEPMMNGGMTELVKNGAPKKKNCTDITNDELWRQAAYASLNHTRCWRAKAMAKIASSLPEFNNFKRILDLGAGPGIIGIAVALEKSDLECVLFDQSKVCDVAEEVITEYSLGSRVSVMRGSYHKDPIGSGYDFIMANFTLNFFKNNLEPILKKVHNALNPGGIFMVTSDGMEENGVAPVETVISWLPTTMQGMNMSIKKGEIANKLLNVGFTSTARHTIENAPFESHGPIEVTIGRKAK